jgi:hypothetical protein
MVCDQRAILFWPMQPVRSDKVRWKTSFAVRTVLTRCKEMWRGETMRKDATCCKASHSQIINMLLREAKLRLALVPTETTGANHRGIGATREAHVTSRFQIVVQAKR